MILSSGFNSDPINFSSSGDNIVVFGVTGKSVLMFRGMGTVSADTVLTFKDGSTSLTGPMTLYAGGSFTYDFSGIPWFQTSLGNNLVINSTNPVQISGVIYYQII